MILLYGPWVHTHRLSDPGLGRCVRGVTTARSAEGYDGLSGAAAHRPGLARRSETRVDVEEVDVVAVEIERGIARLGRRLVAPHLSGVERCVSSILGVVILLFVYAGIGAAEHVWPAWRLSLPVAAVLGAVILPGFVVADVRRHRRKVRADSGPAPELTLPLVAPSSAGPTLPPGPVIFAPPRQAIRHDPTTSWWCVDVTTSAPELKDCRAYLLFEHHEHEARWEAVNSAEVLDEEIGPNEAVTLRAAGPRWRVPVVLRIERGFQRQSHLTPKTARLCTAAFYAERRNGYVEPAPGAHVLHVRVRSEAGEWDSPPYTLTVPEHYEGNALFELALATPPPPELLDVSVLRRPGRFMEDYEKMFEPRRKAHRAEGARQLGGLLASGQSLRVELERGPTWPRNQEKVDSDLQFWSDAVTSTVKKYVSDARAALLRIAELHDGDRRIILDYPGRVPVDLSARRLFVDETIRRIEATLRGLSE